MIVEDKFGNVLYPKTFNVLKKIGENLIEIGYIESIKKPNLFYKKINEGIFFADMRGTKECPMWEEPCPLIYFKFNEDILFWKRRRILKEEIKKLPSHRFVSQFEPSDWGDEEDLYDELNFISEKLYEDGYCHFCKKDFQDEGLFCSLVCEKEYYNVIDKRKYLEIKEKSNNIKCEVCKRNPEVIKGKYCYELEQFIEHHISYSKDETITVCRSCHIKIHRGETVEDYKFKPEISRKEFLKLS